MNKTDIYRLHRVIDGELTGPQVGKTYSQCSQVAGYVLTGVESIYIIITDIHDIGFIERMMKGVFAEQGVTMEKIDGRPGKYKANDTIIRMVNIKGLFYRSGMDGATGLKIEMLR